jgi:hypothetical protein
VNYIPFRRAIKSYGLVGSLFGVLQGRSTAFALAFAICGIWLAFLGKLTAEYVALIGAIQSLIVIHSYKEDLANQAQAQQQQVVNNITVDANAPQAKQ